VDSNGACSNWGCLKGAGYNYSIPRIYRALHSGGTTHGSIDLAGGFAVQASAVAGLYTDVYMFVSGFDSRGGAAQANETLMAIRDLPIGRIWVDVEDTSSLGDEWPRTAPSQPQNQQMFTDIVDTFLAANRRVGLYTSQRVFNELFGSGFTYPFEHGLPIWWPTYGAGPAQQTVDGMCAQHGQPADTTKNWKAFGGITYGLIKQYNSDCTICGCSKAFDVNWKEPFSGGVGLCYNISGASVNVYSTPCGSPTTLVTTLTDGSTVVGIGVDVVAPTSCAASLYHNVQTTGGNQKSGWMPQTTNVMTIACPASVQIPPTPPVFDPNADPLAPNAVNVNANTNSTVTTSAASNNNMNPTPDLDGSMSSSGGINVTDSETDEGSMASAVASADDTPTSAEG